MTINEINMSIKYQGYLWMSNDTKPIVCDGNLSLQEECEKYKNDEERGNGNEPFVCQNPFIIEGQLYDGKKSISIKFVDGKYIVNEYSLSELSGVEKEEKQYVPNRMDLQGKLLTFNQYWRPQADKFCEGMKVLQPAELVFVGFKNKEE